ncbi:MazG nucleotide pyrophosphohydrolase domain-containing protein [Streptomyces sp. MS2.AVA.5]|uniref:MazG nucleotide pyrophosphohydrolase domain-containing protein n=1 Tax=Streptomyces achmelvichensis TaxID=3134111 RepID=A0ACC6PTR3_9ACTN
MQQLVSSPSIKDVQEYVAVLEQERGFDGDSTLQKCLLLAEEVGELFKSLRKAEAGISIDVASTHDANPAAELADILTVLLTIANRLDIDMEYAFRAKEEQDRCRVWR